MTNKIIRLLVGLLITTGCVAKPENNAPKWYYNETARFKAEEARQGVAVDDDFLYVVTNHGLGKYDKKTHQRVAAWTCPEGEPLTHMNAGIVRSGRLYCAHSNFPGVPHTSSVEVWETATLKHVVSHSFGRTDGSLTWFDRRNERWVACFVHYGREGGEPGRGPEWTRLVEFDDEWRPTGQGWIFPTDLMTKLSAHGFSVSGGAIGPGGFLYVSGHDDRNLYLLKFPESGSALEWVDTLRISAEGQAFSWDQSESGVLYTILKRTREVIIGRVSSR